MLSHLAGARGNVVVQMLVMQGKSDQPMHRQNCMLTIYVCKVTCDGSLYCDNVPISYHDTE